jgi:hypothetical protein
MLFSIVLFYFRAHGMSKNLSKILYFDYKCYNGDNPEEYFSKGKAIKIQPALTIENNPEIEGITTERQMINTDKLQLKENNNKTDTIKKLDDVVIGGDRLGEIPETKEKLCNKISIPDYEELSPEMLLKHDNRTTMTYLKDMIVVEHSVLSLIFRKSLKDPLFLRMWMLVYSLSMQFAFNALVYTDDIIDKRQVNKEPVFVF